jgi:hypothetical protein
MFQSRNGNQKLCEVTFLLKFFDNTAKVCKITVAKWCDKVMQVIEWIECCEQVMDNSMSFESDIKKKILGRWAKPFTSSPIWRLDENWRFV